MTKDSETSAEDFFPDRKSLKAFAKQRPIARPAISGSEAPKQFSVKALGTLKLFSSANNPATKKISAASLLSAPPDVYWMKL